MADIAILTGSGNGNGGVESAVIPDTIMNVVHSMSNEISSSPVSGDTDITDNVRTTNNNISVQGYFGDLTHRPESASTAGVTDLVIPSTFFGQRKLKAFELLKKARDQKQSIDLVTGLHVYNNCYIKDFTVTENPDSYGVLNFSLNLEQVRIADVVNSVSVNVIDPKKDSATGVSLGTNNVKTQNSEEEVASTTAKIFDRIGVQQ